MGEAVNEKKERTNKRVLYGVLIGLGVAIVGLIVGIVVVNIVLQGQNSGNEAEDYNVEGDACSEAETMYDMRVCIEQMIEQEDLDTAEEMYNKRINKALEKKYYDLFLTLLEDKMDDMSDNGRCPEALVYMNDFDVDGLPNETKRGFYNIGYSLSKYCENDEEMNEYRQKKEELMTNKEFYENTD